MSGLPVDLVPTHDETRRLEMPEGHEATEEQVAVCAIATKPEQVLRGMRQRDGRGTFPKKLVVPPLPKQFMSIAPCVASPIHKSHPGRSRWSGCVPSMVTSRLPRCPSRHLPAVRGAPRDRGPEHLRRCLRQLHPVMWRRPHRQRRRQLNPKPLQRRLLWSLKRKDQKESRDLPWRRLVPLSHQLVLLRHPILRHTAEESDVGEEAAPAQALAETLVAG